MNAEPSLPRLPHIVPARHGIPIKWRSEMLVKAASSDTEARFTVIETRNLPASGPPLHVHRNEDEAFLVLDGEYTFYFGDQEVEAGPGDFVLLPRGLPHRYRVGDAGGRVLMIFAPAGIEQYFEELAAVLGDEKAENAVAAKFGIELLAPYGSG